MDTEPADHRRSWSPRPWLAAAGIALIVVCLVPPLSGLARRYLFVESIQFCAFALAAPALVALGAPWRLLPKNAARLAGARRRWASFAATLSYLIAWVVLCLFWRLPSAPRLEPSAPCPEPSAPRPERALVAALAMWSLWAIAYVLGFAHDSVVHAYDQAGSHLGTVTDQEITAFLLWAAAGIAFAPVVFTVTLSWLKDSSEPAREPAGRVPGSGVRGWGRPAR